MAGYAMAPLNAPLPTAWNLPFQPDAGIQTSILISESEDGFSDAATRQNAGRSRKVCAAGGTDAAAPPAGIGSVNAPEPTACASVIVALGSFSVAKLSHD